MRPFRLGRIEAKPKEVIIGDYSKHLTPAEEDDLFYLRDLILHGEEIPNRFYGTFVDYPSRDKFLMKNGVVHLHLGGSNSNCIVYLKQFPDRVEIFEISGHRGMEAEMPGLIKKHNLPTFDDKGFEKVKKKTRKIPTELPKFEIPSNPKPVIRSKLILKDKPSNND